MASSPAIMTSSISAPRTAWVQNHQNMVREQDKFTVRDVHSSSSPTIEVRRRPASRQRTYPVQIQLITSTTQEGGAVVPSNRDTMTMMTRGRRSVTRVHVVTRLTKRIIASYPGTLVPQLTHLYFTIAQMPSK